ncbi:MAG: ATP-binding protein [Robinsoniella sp.]|nr:ATP-binding protein [Robinsoniella sp.]
MLITVWDNGVGISRECIEKYFECPPQDMDDTEVEHIGIYNIRKRLSYLYNDQYRLEVKSVPGEGCTILLALALKTS